MKIGDTIEIVTHARKEEEGYRVRLSWGGASCLGLSLVGYAFRLRKSPRQIARELN